MPNQSPGFPTSAKDNTSLEAEEQARRVQEDRFIQEAKTKDERIARAKAVAQARKARTLARATTTTGTGSGNNTPAGQDEREKK